MYHECLSCSKLGVSCDGPNFITMNAHDLLEWCKKRTHYLGLSHAKLAEMAKMSKGTIDRLFAGDYGDYKYETMRPLIRALVGGEVGSNPCPAPDTDLEDKYAIIEEENSKLRERLKEIEQKHVCEIIELKTEQKEHLNFMKGQLKDRKLVIIILSVLLGLALATIIGFLIYDFLNPNSGVFWLT